MKYSDLKKLTLKDIDEQNFYNNPDFESSFTYTKNDLGVKCTKKSTTFKVWLPMAQKVMLNLYEKADSKDATKYAMERKTKGVWVFTIDGNMDGTYYTYTVSNFNDTSNDEILDPYAKAVGVNGLRGMVLDFNKTNPTRWKKDTQIELKSPTDAIIYELHVRDFSIASGDIKNRGKFLAFTEVGTKNTSGEKTCLSHLKELGITHVHLLPIYDFNSIDEADTTKPQYNWGYDPMNFNALEGSYSTDPFNAEVRIKEFKELVKSLHSNGLGVIMDVVYNHTAESEENYLNKAVPHYYHRCNSDGTFSDGSACGNEIASDRSMVSKMIVDSLCYFAKEYHIDGFRFDLMGILDIDTLNKAREELDKINPSIIMYGEGWTGGEILLDYEKSAVKHNTPKLDNRIASFSDDMRDAVKGHVFDMHEKGFVNGASGFVDAVKFGIVASTEHPQIDYSKVNYSSEPWAKEPTQCITYASAHDNLTLFDKLQISMPDEHIDKLIQVNKMIATLVLTSQGISFIHAGEEFLRTKENPDGTLEHNSYISSDQVNKLDWERKSQYLEVFNYYKGLIKLRKEHASFRMPTTKDIQAHLKFFDDMEENVIGYMIDSYEEDSWEKICLYFNPNDEDVEVTLPSNNWVVVVDNVNAGTEKLYEVINCTSFILRPHSHYVLVDTPSFMKSKEQE